MATTTFYWHDYETFGRQPRRDRPSQFAGIRTDEQLREIDEPLVLYCQPPTDALPDPQSCLITGILPQECQQRGLAEHEFAKRIHAQLSQAGTIGAGYNSIAFDDEVSRFLFWRNLMEPYGREWQHDCSRWDLLDVLRCAYAFKPQSLSWPVNDQGRISFRLEHLTRANGVDHGQAHDAASDVRATIGMARLLRDRLPRLWDYCLSLRLKSAVKAQLVLGQPILHVSGKYPVERGCLAVVWALAPHPHHSNEVIVWDLAHDPSSLLSLTASEIRQRLFSRQEDLPEGVSRLPIKTIHLNQAPVVISQLKTLSGELAQRWGIDWTAVDRHALAAGALMGEMAGVWPEVFAQATTGRPVDVDEALYEGFLPEADRRALDQWRDGPHAALAAPTTVFQDGRLEELVFRFRARNYPQSLSESENQRWQAHRQERLLQPARPGELDALSAFFEKLDELQEGASPPQEALLSSLYDWAEQIAP